MPSKATTPASIPPPERGAWAACAGGWRQLCGSFPCLGFSIEHHDLPAGARFDWSRSFHPRSIEICLNFQGRATLSCAGETCALGTAQYAIYRVGDTPPKATRTPGERHCFLTLELSPAFLRDRLRAVPEDLVPIVAEALRSEDSPSAISAPRPLTAAQSAVARLLTNPPVAPAARALWYEARLLEWMAECLFDDAQELFCHRQQRLDRERVDRVKAALAANLENPPALVDLARSIAISPFYLSRTFSRLTGESIPACLRRMRMERAAELLRAGTHNVTEAAFAVGYSSLGHFSRSFSDVLGCPPTRYAGSRENSQGK